MRKASSSRDISRKNAFSSLCVSMCILTSKARRRPEGPHALAGKRRGGTPSPTAPPKVLARLAGRRG